MDIKIKMPPIVIKDIDPDSAAWNKLIDEIIQGNVIPVICPDILVDNYNLHDILVDNIAEAYGVKDNPKSFSDLVYSKDFDVKNPHESIYIIVNSIFANNQFEPSTILKELLSIKQFPFVLTTSFTPLAEDVMREVWGEELKVKRFNNNPSENHDISGADDMRKPTIYYMFGKVGEGAGRYVLTDMDMLSFCSSWVANSGFRPGNLVAQLRNKYLLILGNNYSDWLFRFIWFSFHKAEKYGGEISPSCYAYDTVTDELSRFLERHQTFLRQNPGEVVMQIKKRLAEKLKGDETTKFANVENNTDIFISYSRRDAAIAEELYKQLTASGKRVWYDRNNITSGGKFMNEIRKGIQTAKYFIPLFSHNIETEKNDSHVYRKEWDEAIEQSTSFGRTYIIPIAEKGFNFYKAAIPDRLQQHNAIEYSSKEDIAEVVQKVIHTINQD